MYTIHVNCQALTEAKTKAEIKSYMVANSVTHAFITSNGKPVANVVIRNGIMMWSKV